METSVVREIKEKLYRYINDNEKEIVKLCSEMVKIPSENPPGDMSEIASFIRSWLDDRGLNTESYEPEKGRISLVSSLGEGKGSTLILNGHMDVVPAGDLKRWEFPPYCGEVKKGKILGRGAADMKGGLTSLIMGFEAISKVIEKIPGKIILTVVPDEETGGAYGTGWLVENNKVLGDACLIGEPSGISGCFIGEKGLCWLRLEAKGVPAHGSLPMLGENAIEKLARALPVIRKIEGEKAKIPKDTIEAVQVTKDFYANFVRFKGVTDEAKLKEVTKAIDHNTVNFGVIKGGTKANVVPELCTMDVDVRIPPGTTPEGIRNRLMELLKDAGLADIKCDLILKSNPNYTSPTEKIYSVLKQNVKDIVGTAMKTLYTTAATDARYFRLKGIPTINYGPGELFLVHSYDEYVRVEDVVKATKVITSTTIDFIHSR